MITLPIFHVDAFTVSSFTGNPAGVCLLDRWLPDEIMQKIGMENNISETAFLVRNGNDFNIRWFTPTTEVDLCGHATLASAFVIMNLVEPGREMVIFHSMKLGDLTVRKSGALLELDFPTDNLEKCDLPEIIRESLGGAPVECYKGRSDYLILYKSEKEIVSLNPDFRLLSQADGRGTIVTAPGVDSDFVSRFFVPQAGIDEDPVTGSAHTTLAPFWAPRLGKNVMDARQLSARGGKLRCTLNGDRTLIAGNAELYLKGEIYIQNQ